MKPGLWYLYDFANSFASSVIIFYFPLLLKELGANDLWLSFSVVLSTLVLLIFYPKLGHTADRDPHFKFNAIKLSSFAMLAALIVLGILSQSLTFATFSLLAILCLLYVIFQVGFQGSYVFYSSYLEDFKNQNKSKEAISSYGMGFGQLGNAVSIGLMGAFVVGGSLSLYGISGKSLAFILGGVVFIVLALPFLLQKVKQVSKVEKHELFSYKGFVEYIRKDKKLVYFLLGYLLLSDSIATLQIYLSLYMKNVFSFSDKETSIVGAISLFSLFLTCMLIGRYESKIKDKSRALLTGGLLYVIMFLLFSVLHGSFLFVASVFVFLGIAYGLFFPLARSLFSDIIPRHDQAKFFSSFVIFERAASVLGPLVWVLMLWILNDFSVATQYRGNVFLLGIVALFGLLLIRKSFAKELGTNSDENK
jgi:UMF1 family MFS transporter